MKLLFHAIIGVGLFVALSLTAQAQNSSGRGIKGSVVDLLGSVIPQAVVTATDAKGKRHQAVTGHDGRYELRVPEAGVYKIEVTAAAPFKPFRIDEYQLVEAGLLNLEVSLICEKCELFSHPAESTVPSGKRMAPTRPKSRERKP